MADEEQQDATNDYPDSSDNASFENGDYSNSDKKKPTDTNQPSDKHFGHAHPYIVVNPQKDNAESESLKIGKFANKLTMLGLIVNTLLLLGTLYALQLTRRSVKITEDSVGIAKEALSAQRVGDSLNRISDRQKDSINNVDRANNYQRDSASLDIAKKSSDMSLQSLSETKRSNDFSRVSAMKEIRAYVNIDKIVLKNLAVDSLFTITATCTNVGKTPAYNLKANLKYGLEIRMEDVNTDSLLNSPPFPEPITLGVYQYIAPTIGSMSPMYKKDFPDFIYARIKIYVMVNIEYDDIFNIHHISRSFSVYNPRNNEFNIIHSFTTAD